jgi:hypothetical protein
MNRLVAEVAMKTLWRMRRQTILHPDGQQRWDQAYQHLLRWTQPSPMEPDLAGPSSTQEVSRDSACRHLRPCLDPASDPCSDD